MEEIKNLFPIKAEITQELINNPSNNAHYCIGAKTLKSVMPDKEHKNVYWGRTTGAIYTSEGKIIISTKENIDMPYVTKPTKITFIII